MKLKSLLNYIFLFFTSVVFGPPTNIYFVYGSGAETNQMPLQQSASWQWDALQQKGYNPHEVYNVTPETLLRIAMDKETKAIFYWGHSTYYEGQPQNTDMYLMGDIGYQFAPLDKAAFDLAKERLKLNGLEYQPSPTVDLFHIASCYGMSCVPVIQKELALPNAVYQGWEGVVPANFVIQSYNSGNAAKYFADLPSVTKSMNRTGWEKLNTFYQESLLDDLIALRIGKRKNYTLTELVEIRQQSYPTGDQLRKLFELGLPLIKNTLDLDTLTAAESYWHFNSDAAEARYEFIKDVYENRLDASKTTVGRIKALVWNARLSNEQAMSVYEEVGLKAVKTPEDFISLVTYDPKFHDRTFKKALKAFVDKHSDFFASLNPTRAHHTSLRIAVRKGCEGSLGKTTQQ